MSVEQLILRIILVNLKGRERTTQQHDLKLKSSEICFWYAVRSHREAIIYLSWVTFREQAASNKELLCLCEPSEEVCGVNRLTHFVTCLKFGNNFWDIGDHTLSEM